MLRLTMSCLANVALLIMVSPALAQTDLAGSKDYPGITRMPGYYIAEYQEQEFDSFPFTVTEAGRQKEKPVEGHRYDIRYQLKDGVRLPSQLQVVRNYENAAKAVGGQVLFDSEDATTFRVSKAGSEVWFAVNVANIPSGLVTTMTIIERQAMQQDVTLDAKALAGGLTEAGSVAVYGVYFDTGKSDLKAESEAALSEIAKLLQQDPALKLYVVGHTDMVASAETNIKLSQARAQAVVSALVTKHGITGTRLIAYGAGPYAPVATNKTEEGRAKNRRVELVEIATN